MCLSCPCIRILRGKSNRDSEFKDILLSGNAVLGDDLLHTCEFNVIDG